jgi:hypothetical protein
MVGRKKKTTNQTRSIAFEFAFAAMSKQLCNSPFICSRKWEKYSFRMLKLKSTQNIYKKKDPKNLTKKSCVLSQPLPGAQEKKAH